MIYRVPGVGRQGGRGRTGAGQLPQECEPPSAGREGHPADETSRKNCVSENSLNKDLSVYQSQRDLLCDLQRAQPRV